MNPGMTLDLLLCTDLDRTLIPNGPQLQSPNALALFTELSRLPGVTLVYVTGRDSTLVRDAIDLYCLPTPQYAIIDVGSDICRIDAGNNWQQLEDWRETIAKDWQGHLPEKLAETLQHLQGITLQEAAKQGRFKLSYYYEPNADRKTLHRMIHDSLTAIGVDANLVWSYDEMAGKGLLDILPASASKETAILFLMKRLQHTLSSTVFSGDSGNDLPVLTSSINSVLVANAADDVRQHAMQGAAARGSGASLYLASGTTIPGLNGNYSAGILEGIAHYMPEVRNWLLERL